MIYIGVVLVIIGVILVFVIRPISIKATRKLMNMNVTNVAKLVQIFEQKTILNQGETYYEYAELNGQIRNEELVVSPFSKKQVAFYRSSASIIVRKFETFKDDRGYDQKKEIIIERTIFNKQSDNKLRLVDASSGNYVVIESNSGGCEFNIPLVFDKQVSNEEFKSYNLDINLPADLLDGEIIGYHVREEVLENNYFVYVAGEARKSGGVIHICLSRNLKKPLIVSTKTKAEYLEKRNLGSSFLFFIIGIIIMFIGLLIFCI